MPWLAISLLYCLAPVYEELPPPHQDYDSHACMAFFTSDPLWTHIYSYYESTSRLVVRSEPSIGCVAYLLYTGLAVLMLLYGEVIGIPIVFSLIDRDAYVAPSTLSL